MLERVGSMGTRALRDLHMHLHNGSDVMVLNTTVDVFPESAASTARRTASTARSTRRGSAIRSFSAAG